MLVAQTKTIPSRSEYIYFRCPPTDIWIKCGIFVQWLLLFAVKRMRKNWTGSDTAGS